MVTRTRLNVTKPLKAELNPICHKLALQGAPYIYDISSTYIAYLLGN